MTAVGRDYIMVSYERVRQLHHTERGEVWLAADRTGALFVLKEIHQTGLPYRTLKEHPNGLWPEIRYCIEADGQTIVVEEYIGGHTLAERLAKKRCLTEQEAQAILLQLAAGLVVLHDMGIIHRDIKPSNLILQGSGMVRLIDFDAARIVKPGEIADTTLLGTKGYAPPEQFGFGQTDARSDLYALGKTMQVLLGTDYHGWLMPILVKCTEIDPKRRYASAAALYAALQHHRRQLWLRRLGAAVLAAGMLFGAVFWLCPTALPVMTDASEDNAAAEEELPVSQEEETPESIAGSQPGVSTAEPSAASAQGSLPTSDRYGRKVAVTAFFNGEERNNLSTYTVPNSEWQTWPQSDQQADQSRYVYWPADWSIRVRVQSYDSVTATDLQLAVTFDPLGGTKSAPQIFTAEDLPPGAVYDFIVPLGNHPVKIPEGKMTRIYLRTTWKGAQGAGSEGISWDVWLH